MSTSLSQLVEDLLQASNRVLDDVFTLTVREKTASYLLDPPTLNNKSDWTETRTGHQDQPRPDQPSPDQRCAANHGWVLFQKENKEKKTEETHKRAASQPMGTQP